jgi:hypothetical protein
MGDETGESDIEEEREMFLSLRTKRKLEHRILAKTSKIDRLVFEGLNTYTVTLSDLKEIFIRNNFEDRMLQ